MAEIIEEESSDDLVINIRALEIQPFMFEPMSALNEGNASSSSSAEESEGEEDVNPERIGNTDW